MRNRLKKIFKYFVSDEYIRARTSTAMRRVGYLGTEYIQDRDSKKEVDTK